MLARIGQFFAMTAVPLLERPVGQVTSSTPEGFADPGEMRIANTMRPVGKCVATVLAGTMLSGCLDNPDMWVGAAIMGASLVAGGAGVLLAGKAILASVNGVTKATLARITDKNFFDDFAEDRPHKIQEAVDAGVNRIKTARLPQQEAAVKELRARAQAADEMIAELIRLGRQNDVRHGKTGKLMTEELTERRANNLTDAAELDGRIGTLRSYLEFVESQKIKDLLKQAIKQRAAAQADEDAFNALVARIQKFEGDEVAVAERVRTAFRLSGEDLDWLQRGVDVLLQIGSRQEVGGVAVPLLTQAERLDGLDQAIDARAREILAAQVQGGAA